MYEKITTTTTLLQHTLQTPLYLDRDKIELSLYSKNLGGMGGENKRKREKEREDEEKREKEEKGDCKGGRGEKERET